MFTPFSFVKNKAAGGAPPGPSYNRNIVTRGLINYLDAGETASYPGSGSVWYDLTPNAYDFNQVGSPTWTSAGTSSYFQLDNANNFDNTDAALYGLSLNAQFTICVIIDANNGYSNGDTWGTGAGQQGSVLFMLYNGANGMRGHTWMDTGVNVIDQTSSFPSNTKSMMSYAMDWTGGNCVLWQDGSPNKTQALTGTIPTVLGVSSANLATRGAGGGDLNARFYAVLVYDTLLTDSEIAQNWAAF
jgi:hypothetical protein